MEQEKLDRKELAKKMALSRSKVSNRRPLQDSKSAASQEGAEKPRLFRRGNMLSITGQEANGWQISPGTLQTACFVFFLIIMMAHVFTKGTIYRSVNPLVSEYYQPPIVPPQAQNIDVNATMQ